MLPMIASMMLAAAAPTGAIDVDAVPPFDPQALATCQAFVAQTPDFSQLSDDEMPRSSQFIDEVMGLCSKIILPLWDDAHARARAELGLPQDNSLPMTPEVAGRSIGEMDVAERHLRSIVAERWSDARGLRHQTLKIAPATIAEYMVAWLHSKDHAENLIKASEKSVECVADRMRSDADLNALMSGGARFIEIAHGCAFESAVDSVSAALRERFPTSDQLVSREVADSFLRQIVFWSLTGQRASRSGQ